MMKSFAVSAITALTLSATIGATVAQALAIKGLTMVEVDMNAVGEFPPYYPFNQRLG